jgi:hypothetical protein
MKAFFIAKAKSPNPKSCMATLNSGLRLVLGIPTQPIGSEIQTTMQKFQAAEVAGPQKVIEFKDARGRITRGILELVTLEEASGML